MLFSGVSSSIAPLLTLKAVGHIQLKENLQNEEDALLSERLVQARVKGKQQNERNFQRIEKKEQHTIF